MNDFHSMYLLHIHLKSPDSIGFRFDMQTRPLFSCLLCDFCSSGRNFASGFLQIPPRDGHPCLRLTLPTVKRVRDFHLIVTPHAGRTCSFFCCHQKKERNLPTTEGREKSPQMTTFGFFCRTSLRLWGQKASGSHHLWTACAHFIQGELLN